MFSGPTQQSPKFWRGTLIVTILLVFHGFTRRGYHKTESHPCGHSMTSVCHSSKETFLYIYIYIYIYITVTWCMSKKLHARAEKCEGKLFYGNFHAGTHTCMPHGCTSQQKGHVIMALHSTHGMAQTLKASENGTTVGFLTRLSWCYADVFRHVIIAAFWENCDGFS